MVMVTGIGIPFSIFCVRALKSLQNCMMLSPRWPSAGPIGGAGLAAPAGTCSFRKPATFFAIFHSREPATPARVRGPVRARGEARPRLPQECSALLDLAELEFDRGGPAENADCHFQARAVLVDLFNRAAEGGERTVGYANLLAHFEDDRGLAYHALLD